MRILGIDPGTATTGFGVIEYNERNHQNNYKLLDYGCIKTTANLPLSIRLRQINTDLATLLQAWKPETVAIEELFFSKNVKTAIHVAHARGSIIQQLATNNYDIGEYKPQQIKEAVCGYGKAEKIQVQKMVQIILKMDELPYPDDAADALAVAICHANNVKTNKLLLYA